jgi:hypothetical protein
MKNTSLILGLALGGGLAYLYLKDKKSLSENTVSTTPTIPNGSDLPKKDSISAYNPVYKGYDPAYNASLENQKQVQSFYESDFWKSKNPSASVLEKIVNPFGGVPKVLPSSTDYVITPDNTQGVVRPINQVAIDKMPDIVNQEDIELFFFNNPNISSIEDNTIRDAKGYPIYQKIRKSDVQKDALGAVVSGYSNGYNFYKENNKFYIKEATNAGINPLASAYIICEISESDWLDFFINVKDGSYRKINSPAIKKLNCSTYRNGVKSIW